MADPTGDDRIEHLLDRPADLPPARREAFLDAECAGDPAFNRRLLDGATLPDVIPTAGKPGHGLPVGVACEIGRQVAAGLAALAAAGLVHRDLSPPNLFLTRDGGVKILDFGLVRLADPGRRPEDW